TQARGARHRRPLAHRMDFDGQTAPFGERVDVVDHPARGFEPDLVVGVPDIERQLDATGDHVGGARLDLKTTDCGHEARTPPRFLLDRNHEHRGEDEGVTALLHRHRSRMPGRAGEGDTHPILTGYSVDHPDGQTEALQHRPLLDVHLDVTERRFSGPPVVGDPPRGPTELTYRLRHAETGVVDALELVLSELPRDRATSEICRPVAQPF